MATRATDESVSGTLGLRTTPVNKLPTSVGSVRLDQLSFFHVTGSPFLAAHCRSKEGEFSQFDFQDCLTNGKLKSLAHRIEPLTRVGIVCSPSLGKKHEVVQSLVGQPIRIRAARLEQPSEFGRESVAHLHDHAFRFGLPELCQEAGR